MNYRANGDNVIVHEKVKFGENVEIGHCTLVGCGDPENGEIVIESNVVIGAFCVIHFGAVIKEGATIDNYCQVGVDAVIGRKTKLLYGKHVYDEAEIGENCIIGGHVADRTVIEDNVTYLGEIAHSHRKADGDWDETTETYPTIKKGSVVGVNALIIGGLTIGPCAYIGAGEIVRTNVGEGMSLMKGLLKPLTHYRGMFKTRC